MYIGRWKACFLSDLYTYKQGIALSSIFARALPAGRGEKTPQVANPQHALQRDEILVSNIRLNGIPVDLHFLHHRHKASCASYTQRARAACFEVLACVFASTDATFDVFSRDFDEKYGISLSRCHARIGYILCTHHSWRSTPGQLLKKVAQAKSKGLLHLFVLSSSKLFNRLFHLILIYCKEMAQ